MELIFTGLQFIARGIQPFLVPLCFVIAWAVTLMGLWNVWAAVRDSWRRGQQMHRVPCADCQFFTHDYHLKCPVHPATALSEAAIDCPDFETTALVAPQAISAHK